MSLIKSLLNQGAELIYFTNTPTGTKKKISKVLAVLSVKFQDITFQFKYSYTAENNVILSSGDIIELNPDLTDVHINTEKAIQMGIETTESIHAVEGKNLLQIGGRIYYSPFVIKKGEDDLINIRIKFIKHVMKHVEETGEPLMTHEHRILKAMGLKLLARI